MLMCYYKDSQVEVVEYERFSKLNMEDKNMFKSFNDVRPGDCLIAFSYQDIFRLRKQIEEIMKIKKIRGENNIVEEVLPIVGVMPAEVKADIIKKFNENNYRSCIVATDAIGMGMNLNIRRIIFTSVAKSMMGKRTPLTATQVKQIAGRAGRAEKVGYVNTLKGDDWDYVNQMLQTKDEYSKEKTCLLPTREVLQEYADNLALHTGCTHHLHDILKQQLDQCLFTQQHRGE
eukprot:TRINITY_DN120151_c0_g1_i1.p2 TRINITY_DN120151_c0_g1~~TRINITY_DN120151_c0_g1_i1.p2  ORF type:complete len:231 (-),score=16.99 TRINITY_DN120151_c0_g1_i1:1210-1902(-)